MPPIAEATAKTTVGKPAVNDGGVKKGGGGKDPKITIVTEKRDEEKNNGQGILKNNKDKIKPKRSSVTIREVGDQIKPKEVAPTKADERSKLANKEEMKLGKSTSDQKKDITRESIAKQEDEKVNKDLKFEDTCPHRMWRMKPGERALANPRGKGSPWYQPPRRKEDVEREAEERREQEKKNISERLKAYKMKQKKRLKEEKDKRDKEKKKEEKEKRKLEIERKKKLKTGKITPCDSAYYDPCPHRSWKPDKKKKKDKSAPRGFGTPWYEPVRKYADICKEAEEKRKKEYEKDSKKWKRAYEKRRKVEKKKTGREGTETETEEDEDEEDSEEEREKEEKRLNALRKKYKGANSSKYDPCPHKVWQPKKVKLEEEIQKATPRGAGTPWYEPTRKKVDIDKEMEKKYKAETLKDFKLRKEEYEERLKEREEKLEAKKKEEKRIKEEKEKEEELKRQKQEERDRKQKEKEDKKRKEQKEQRKRDREQAKQEEEKGEGKKDEKKYKPGDSSQYDPCPHRVFHPKAGKKSMDEPRGIGSPWYETTKKKVDVDREEEEKSKKEKERDHKKRKEDYDQRKRKKEEQETEQREKERKKQEQEKKKKEKKKEEDAKKYQPGLSYLYDPCPHKVWNPKPGEKDLAAPSGFGSPWYERVKTKQEIEKEQEESRKKEEKASQKRKDAHDKRQKEKEEKEEKEKREEEKKKKQQEKENEEKEKKKAEKKKKKDEKQKKKEEQRRKEREERDKKDKEEGKDKKKEPIASYLLEPCPHKVYNPRPGEKDKAEPKGVGAPWYVPTRKKEDIDKEEMEKQKQEKEKQKAKRKERAKEQLQKENEEKEKKKKLQEEDEERAKAEESRKAKSKERRRKEKEIEDEKHREIGQGIRNDKVDISPEITWMMDFMSNVDRQERERRGEALRQSRQQIEDDIMADAAKEAFVRDFSELVKTFIEAEWGKADTQLKLLQKQEKKRRKQLLSSMDPLAKDMLEEGKRFNLLCNAALGKKQKKGSGEGTPSALEDLMVSQVMKQMDTMFPLPHYASVV